MPLITWNDSLTISFEEIDTQHRRWIELINELHEAMRLGKGRQVMARVLAEMLEYTRTHFAAEERIMEDRSYPGYRRPLGFPGGRACDYS